LDLAIAQSEVWTQRIAQFTLHESYIIWSEGLAN